MTNLDPNYISSILAQQPVSKPEEQEVGVFIVGIEFSPVVEIGVSKGNISTQETTYWNTTFELYLTWLVFKCNQ